jgi:hypothetical protein
VHSLWVTLWKEKNFDPPYAADLRKLGWGRVEKIFFCRTFIHSLQGRAVDCGPNLGLKLPHSSLNRDQFHSNGAELTPRPSDCMRRREYAVDNSNLA